MTPIDPASIALLGTASVAITQIFKDLGVQGEWLKVVCLAVSVVLGYVMLYQPALWSALVVPLVGATGTGGVSLVKELASPRGSRPAGD